jgi:hypothetical protein
MAIILDVCPNKESKSILVEIIEYTTTAFIAPNKNNSTCISSVLIGHSIMPNNVTIPSQTYYDLAILQSFLPVT